MSASTDTSRAFEKHVRSMVKRGYMPVKQQLRHDEAFDEGTFVRLFVLDRRMPDVHLMPLVRIVFAADQYRVHFKKGRLPRELRVRDWLYGVTIQWFQDKRPTPPLTDAQGINIVSAEVGYSEATIRRDLHMVRLHLQS